MPALGTAALEHLGVALAHALEPWFMRAHRDLSWRRTRDPYAIWVSEIMLQQTRVETVERYFSAFLQRFPDVGALAAAHEDAVLEAWSGLGYYRRARLLHRGARYVVERLGGVIPPEAAALRRIPGIGRYTAGAVSAIAFDRPAALVDGNVARVFSRIRGLEDPAQQGAEADEHWRLADVVLQQGSPRVLAQALMELGATTCTPRSPRCLLCPVRSECVAWERGATARIPAPRKKVEQPLERWGALAVFVDGRLLLVRRPSDGLLADLWCLPLVPRGGEDLERAATRALLGKVPVGEPLPGIVRHVFTHRIWELAVYRVELDARAKRLPADTTAWIASGERPAGGVPSVTEKLLARLVW